LSFSSLESAVQHGFGDLQRPADISNGVFRIIVEGLGNTELSAGQGFWPAADTSPGMGCGKSCLCSSPDEISLKFRKSSEDVENKFPPARCRINVLRQALKLLSLEQRVKPAQPERCRSE
jgi:hypothetical protein